MTVLEIMAQAKSLSPQERKELAKWLIDTLDNSQVQTKHSLLEFEGIAAHLADTEDPQDYVRRIRQEWDERL